MRRLKQRAQATLRSEKGQSLFLVAIMVMSFIMFFSFTLNTGLLIHAKISVQSAADAAAYAGAATQGRQLNAISFLNYDMRRQYKKFLFRNIFIGSMANPGFPNNSDGGASSPLYDFPRYDRRGPVVDFDKKHALTVPVICVPLIKGDHASHDNCLALNQRDTTEDLKSQLGILISAGSSVVQTYIDASKAISSVQDSLCKGQGLINNFILFSWAFRGDSEDSELQNILDKLYSDANTDPNVASMMTQKTDILNQLKGLTHGLGLYPRNLFNLMRIKTLVEFLNEPPATVTDDELSAWEGGGAEAHERSILAFKSAQSNLNTAVFDVSKTELQELQPKAMIKDVKPVEVDLDAFVQSMEVGPAAAPPPGDPKTFCKISVNQVPLLNIPVGADLIRTPGRNVIYGVKLKAFVKPRGLFFAPWNEALELDAYAGAKPFGSRTGPVQGTSPDEFRVAQQDVSVEVNGNFFCNSTLGTTHKCNIPKMELGLGGNTFSRDYLGELKTLALNNGPMITADGLKIAQYHAMAPNPVEVGRYGILPVPPDPQNLQFEFIPFADPKSLKIAETSPDKSPPIYRFYAPIFPQKGTVDPSALITKYLDQTLSGSLPNKFGITMSVIKGQVKSAMMNYLNKLSTRIGTENQESEAFAALELPMYNLKKAKNKQYWLMESEDVLTSWAPPYVRVANGFAFRPRFGYSVRFVSMRDLQKEGLDDPDSEFENVGH